MRDDPEVRCRRTHEERVTGDTAAVVPVDAKAWATAMGAICAGIEGLAELGYPAERIACLAGKLIDEDVVQRRKNTESEVVATVNGKGDLAMESELRKFVGQRCVVEKQTKDGRYVVVHPDGSKAAVAKWNLNFQAR